MCDDHDRATGRDRAGLSGLPPHRRRLSLFGRALTLPENRLLRVAIGVVLCLGGLLWFLPVIGLWMLPLGLAVLSIDIPFVRRHSRRAMIWLRRRYPALAAKLFPRDR